MNKKAMLARDFVIVLSLFVTITGIGYVIVGNMASSDLGYNVENMTDETFQENYEDLSNAIGKDVEQMRNATSSKEGLSVISTFTTMFSATFKIIPLVLGSFNMVRNTMNNFGEYFDVPSIISNLIFSAIIFIITVVIVFVIISSVSKGRL